MTTYYQIPLEGGQANANQTFNVEVNNIKYRFDVRFDQTTDNWILNLYKLDIPYALNLALLTGSLINSLVSRQMGASLFVTGFHDPTLDSLGTDNYLMLAIKGIADDV